MGAIFFNISFSTLFSTIFCIKFFQALKILPFSKSQIKGNVQEICTFLGQVTKRQ